MRHDERRQRRPPASGRAGAPERSGGAAPTVDGGAREAGFTLIELIIVVALLGILAAMAMPSLRESPRRAEEAVLRTNLHTMRDVIDQYKGDKGSYPPSLEALVDDGYLRDVPLDPITDSRDTWEVVYEEIDEEAPFSETDFGEFGSTGVIDVHSGSDEESLDGTPYSEW